MLMSLHSRSGCQPRPKSREARMRVPHTSNQNFRCSASRSLATENYLGACWRHLLHESVALE